VPGAMVMSDIAMAANAIDRDGVDSLLHATFGQIFINQDHAMALVMQDNAMSQR
jgi:hypothetical protein